MASLKNLLKNDGKLIKEEYHLCCYDPAMWLEKGTLISVINSIQGEEALLDYWPQKPVGNGPWSWPLGLLTPKQVEILKKRYWKTKNVFIYEVQDKKNIPLLLNDKDLVVNFLESENKLFVYLPSDREYQISYYIDDLKSVTEFYEIIEEYFGRYILFDVEKNNIFVSSTEGPYGSYTLAYDQLGRKGCRNYACVYKCPVFPLDEHIKKVTYRLELIVQGLTSEVRGIIIYDIDNNILAKLNEEGEFEKV
ncbi:MAG: hypothetical protein PWQ67_721 [Clostridia bacterium]|jgi:hypothetical protein|nr:hypothetical protein [Clostridia bacterium]MDN5322267.1 hypothetical protein [Clostridia bacterium]